MNNLSNKIYLRRAYTIANILRIAPFVRMVALDGSVASGKAREESDIDFFIVAKTGRIWTTRLFVTLIVHLTGFRRYGSKVAGRICLNRYQTEDYLEIRPQSNLDALDYINLIPLWYKGDIYPRYCKVNHWVKKYGLKINVWRKKESSGTKILALILFFFQKINEILCELILNEAGEKWLGKVQTEKIVKNPLSRNQPPGRISVSEKELRFHPIKFLTTKN